MAFLGRRILFPIVAFSALALSGSVASQEKGKGDPPEKAKVVDSTKDVADLKKLVGELQKDLEGTKKGLGETTSKLSDTSKGVSLAEKKASDAEKKAIETGVAVKGMAGDLEKATKSLSAEIEKAAKAGGSSEETKKGLEAATKGIDEAKAAAGTALTTGKERGDTAWILVASAFVFFMVPGLALFYGGMVRKKNVLATMMQSMAALAVVGVYWIAIGYALAFGPSVVKAPDGLLGVDGGGLFGWSWDLFFLQGINFDAKLPGYDIPVYIHVMFQGMFAIITPALISGAIAERIRFWPFCIFMILWVTFVYCPLAHMVWAFDWFDPSVLAAKRGASAIGFLGKLGALDFAGGTVVHIAAGMAGLAACLVLRKRDGYPKTVTHPNSMVLTLLGAGLLWFGWFGFNGGSALNSTAQAVSAFTATQAAAAAAGLAWMLLEWVHKGKPTALGLASGIVAGLVAVTPASGYVYAYGGIAIGVAAAVVCYLAVTLKGLLGYDDSLDAFGVHGVGGFVGAVLTGVFCSTAIYPAGGDGYFAYKYHRARATELETKLISPAKSAAADATKAVEAAEAELKKVPETEKAKFKDAEKVVADAKDIETDKKATADGYEADLKKLKELFDKQDDKEGDGKAKKNEFTQLTIQAKAAGISAVFAFVASLILALLTHLMTLGNFRTSKKDETDGLDRSEHGEVGFDFGFATESVTSGAATPRAASSPKADRRFELAVEGVSHSDLGKAWTALCQPSQGPTNPDFALVYKHVTTIDGNKFKCRGGDPTVVATRLESLFKKLMPGKPVKVVRV